MQLLPTSLSGNTMPDYEYIIEANLISIALPQWTYSPSRNCDGLGYSLEFAKGN
jgi:hypothetical protein